MENLYDYIFHYNPFTKLWSAIPREKHNEYWNNMETDGVLKSENINTLMILIQKGSEFIDSIE
jgi:hypothetical protein